MTPPCPVYLKAAGSTAMTPLLQDLAAAYHERQPDVTVDINTGGSALGPELAAAGQVDLGLTSWLPDGPPQGVQATVVARDGIALIVHPTNVITGLTPARRARPVPWQPGQLAGGRRSAVGGADGESRGRLGNARRV